MIWHAGKTVAAEQSVEPSRSRHECSGTAGMAPEIRCPSLLREPVPFGWRREPIPPFDNLFVAAQGGRHFAEYVGPQGNFWSEKNLGCTSMPAQPKIPVSQCARLLDENPGASQSANDDLHSPVLRLAYARTRRHQQVRIAEALNGDSVFRHAILD
jgi:hypothetical protein